MFCSPVKLTFPPPCQYCVRDTLFHSSQFCDISLSLNLEQWWSENSPCPGLTRYKSAGKLFLLSPQSGDSHIKLSSSRGWCNSYKVRLEGVSMYYWGSTNILEERPRQSCSTQISNNDQFLRDQCSELEERPIFSTQHWLNDWLR